MSRHKPSKDRPITPVCCGASARYKTTNVNNLGGSKIWHFECLKCGKNLKLRSGTSAWVSPQRSPKPDGGKICGRCGVRKPLTHYRKYAASHAKHCNLCVSTRRGGWKKCRACTVRKSTDQYPLTATGKRSDKCQACHDAKKARADYEREKARARARSRTNAILGLAIAEDDDFLPTPDDKMRQVKLRWSAFVRVESEILNLAKKDVLCRKWSDDPEAGRRYYPEAVAGTAAGIGGAQRTPGFMSSPSVRAGIRTAPNFSWIYAGGT